MKKERSVPVQKGSINPDQRTMKHSTREEKTMQDTASAKLLFDGQTLKFHSPKQ
jgi:hypothetical protein